MEKLRDRKHLNLDNPDDVDWLYDWAKLAQKELTELREKVSRVELPVKPDACVDARIDELNKLQQTLNPYQTSEKDYCRAIAESTVKNTIIMRINELQKESKHSV